MPDYVSELDENASVDHVAADQLKSAPDAGSAAKIDIHDHWKGRLAPLPGFSSRTGLLPQRVSHSIKIVKPGKTRQKRRGRKNKQSPSSNGSDLEKANNEADDLSDAAPVKGVETPLKTDDETGDKFVSRPM